MGTQPLYNPNDSITGRDGGPYLDQEEAKYAEIRRAAVEGREPDLENPGATAGIPLVNASQLLATATINNIPSQDGNVAISNVLVDSSVASENTLLKPVAEIDVDALNDVDSAGTVDPTTEGGESLSEMGKEPVSTPKDVAKVTVSKDK